MTNLRADAILLRSTAAIPDLALRTAAREVNLSFEQLERWLALDSSSTYAYFWLPAETSVPDALVPAFRNMARQSLTGREGIEVVRLASLNDLPGASATKQPEFHYVVETDVEAVAEADFNAWYEQEHLPGLAAVPGTVRARRFLSLDGAPRYHARYELLSTETLKSEAWLAVRHTSWSDRIRPRFRNTRRLMFRRAG